METKAHHVLIGLFTLIVIAAAFGLVLYASGASGLRAVRVYVVTFKGSVGGLTGGAIVTFNGLQVGDVTHVGLVPSDPGRVEAVIRVDADVPVKTDTTARLESQGLGGATAVALIGGAANAPNLVGENGQPPTLNGEPSQLQNLLENVSSLSAKTQSVLDNVNSLISDNKAAIGDTVGNLDVFSKSLGDNAPAIKDALASVAEVGKRIGPLADHVDALAGHADKVVAALDPDQVRDIVGNVADLSKKLDAAADKIGGVMASLQSLFGSPETKGALAEAGAAARSVRVLADDLDQRVKVISNGLERFSNSGLREYEALAADGRRTLADLDQLLRSLEKNPSQLLFGKK